MFKKINITDGRFPLLFKMPALDPKPLLRGLSTEVLRAAGLASLG